VVNHKQGGQLIQFRLGESVALLSVWTVPNGEKHTTILEDEKDSEMVGFKYWYDTTSFYYGLLGNAKVIIKNTLSGEVLAEFRFLIKY
jgi:hypothetical protein